MMVGMVVVWREGGGVCGVVGVCVVVDLIGVLYFILEIDNLLKVRLVVHIGYVDWKKNEPKQLRLFNPITRPHLTAHRLIIGGEMHSAGVEQSNCLGWLVLW